MSNLLGAVGCAQLDRLPKVLRRKRRIFEFYCGLFGQSHVPALPFPCAEGTRPTNWLSVFLFPSETLRDKVAARLAAADIECRPVWKPLHLQPVFASSRVYGGEVAEDLFRRGLCLPSGAGLTGAQLARIARALAG